MSSGDEAIELSGHLDGRRSAEVREALHAHIEAHPDQEVRVDVTKVESIDATAFNLLAAAAVKVRRAGGTIVLVGCSATLHRILAQRGWRRLFRLERPV